MTGKTSNLVKNIEMKNGVQDDRQAKHRVTNNKFAPNLLAIEHKIKVFILINISFNAQLPRQSKLVNTKNKN